MKTHKNEIKVGSWVYVPAQIIGDNGSCVWLVPWIAANDYVPLDNGMYITALLIPRSTVLTYRNDNKKRRTDCYWFKSRKWFDNIFNSLPNSAAIWKTHPTNGESCKACGGTGIDVNA